MPEPFPQPLRRAIDALFGPLETIGLGLGLSLAAAFLGFLLALADSPLAALPPLAVGCALAMLRWQALVAALAAYGLLGLAAGQALVLAIGVTLAGWCAGRLAIAAAQRWSESGARTRDRAHHK